MPSTNESPLSLRLATKSSTSPVARTPYRYSLRYRRLDALGWLLFSATFLCALLSVLGYIYMTQFPMWLASTLSSIALVCWLCNNVIASTLRRQRQRVGVRLMARAASSAPAVDNTLTEQYEREQRQLQRDARRVVRHESGSRRNTRRQR